MSDNFFYDLNKKMADLANKQQLAENAVAAQPKNKLTEAAADYSAKKAAAGKDIGKPGKNFGKIAADAAKRYGSAEAGKRVAGAVLNKLRHPTQESVDESALQAAIGKKKYGDQGMKALQKAGRDHAGKEKMAKIRKQYDQYDESMTDEGNAFGKAVVDAKRDGIQPGEKIRVGGKQYSLREQGMAEGLDIVQQGRLNDLIELYRDATDPSYGGYGLDDQYDPDEVIEAIRTEFGNKIASQVEAGTEKMHYGRHDIQRGDPLTLKKPIDRITKAGKMYKQDSDYMKNTIKSRYALGGKSATEGSVPTAPMNPDGATAPPAKGADGQYPVVTSGPNKGKRWSPNTPGPTNPAMKEGSIPMTSKQKSFAKLAPPVDKITFADKIVGAKQKAVRGRDLSMEESSLYDTPTLRRSSSGGEIDTSEPGVTRHRAVKGNYSGAGHDVGADDDTPRSGQAGRRRVGAGMGKKIGAKINRGTSKLMTREGNMDPSEYDQEGSMAKDDIKTVVRHARALEKILGDNDNLPEWVQAKLAKIEGMMTAVDDYMQNRQDDKMKMDEESANKRDHRAERAGRRVAKDIEYDEKKKDGIHGKRRGSEDNKAERAGRRVTKDIEYDEKHKKNESSTQHFDKGYYDSVDTAKKDNSKSIVKARKQPFEEESTNTRDDRAERAGRKVAKDIEYDEKKKDGIHGKRRGSEDNKAERAGRRVTKDIEYDEKKSKKKEVDETTSSGSVATGGSAPKSGGSVGYGKGIYDSFNREVEKMISESMSINMSMNNHSHGGPAQTLTVTATDEDAMQLAMLLKSAGIGSQDHGDDMHSMTDDDSEMDVIHGMDHDYRDETCSSCGCSDCECDEMNEAYGDTDATDNEPDYPTDEVGTDDAMMYSGGLNGPKSTGQTTIPVISGQHDRMGYEGDRELRRMMEIAGISR